MANNTISQVDVNGTTYDLLDANTLSAVSALDARVTALESSVEFTYNPGNYGYDTTDRWRINKLGSLVSMSVASMKNLSYGNNSFTDTINNQIRPSRNYDFDLQGPTTHLRMKITPAGNVSIYNYTNDSTVNIYETVFWII